MKTSRIFLRIFYFFSVQNGPPQVGNTAERDYASNIGKIGKYDGPIAKSMKYWSTESEALKFYTMYCAIYFQTQTKFYFHAERCRRFLEQ